MSGVNTAFFKGATELLYGVEKLAQHTNLKQIWCNFEDLVSKDIVVFSGREKTQELNAFDKFAGRVFASLDYLREWTGIGKLERFIKETIQNVTNPPAPAASPVAPASQAAAAGADAASQAAAGAANQTAPGAGDAIEKTFTAKIKAFFEDPVGKTKEYFFEITGKIKGWWSGEAPKPATGTTPTTSTSTPPAPTAGTPDLQIEGNVNVTHGPQPATQPAAPKQPPVAQQPPVSNPTPAQPQPQPAAAGPAPQVVATPPAPVASPPAAVQPASAGAFTADLSQSAGITVDDVHLSRTNMAGSISNANTRDINIVPITNVKGADVDIHSPLNLTGDGMNMINVAEVEKNATLGSNITQQAGAKADRIVDAMGIHGIGGKGKVDSNINAPNVKRVVNTIVANDIGDLAELNSNITVGHDTEEVLRIITGQNFQNGVKLTLGHNRLPAPPAP